MCCCMMLIPFQEDCGSARLGHYQKALGRSEGHFTLKYKQGQSYFLTSTLCSDIYFGPMSGLILLWIFLNTASVIAED